MSSPSPGPHSPSNPSSPNPAAPPIADDSPQEPDLPLTMAASVVLSALPRDAHEALEGAGDLGVEKVTVRFLPTGSAPPLASKQKAFKISATQRFEAVVRFLRKKLAAQGSLSTGTGTAPGSVFCYVNHVFAPSLDEGVGNLWRCFKVKDELVVAYSVTPAFG